jgi:hypothetical protein
VYYALDSPWHVRGWTLRCDRYTHTHALTDSRATVAVLMRHGMMCPVNECTVGHDVNCLMSCELVLA